MTIFLCFFKLNQKYKVHLYYIMVWETDLIIKYKYKIIYLKCYIKKILTYDHFFLKLLWGESIVK